MTSRSGKLVEKGAKIRKIPVKISLMAKKVNLWEVRVQYLRNVKAVAKEVTTTPNDLKEIFCDNDFGLN